MTMKGNMMRNQASVYTPMNKTVEKILEPVVLIGMTGFLLVMFGIFTVEHFFVRPPMRLLGLGEYKKRKRKRL